MLDDVFNAFSYKQAQVAMRKGLNKLKQLGIPSKRPEDYFAEMLKTDDHMQRVLTFTKSLILTKESVKCLTIQDKIASGGQFVEMADQFLQVQYTFPHGIKTRVPIKGGEAFFSSDAPRKYEPLMSVI